MLIVDLLVSKIKAAGRFSPVRPSFTLKRSHDFIRWRRQAAPSGEALREKLRPHRELAAHLFPSLGFPP